MRKSNSLFWQLFAPVAFVLAGVLLLLLILTFATPLADQLWSGYNGLIVLAAVLLITCWMFYWRFSRYMQRPLQSIRDQVENFRGGNFSARVEVNPTDLPEIQHLATELNQVANQLWQDFKQVKRKMGQHTTVFASMTEGVMSVDHKEKRVTLVNAAACSILGVEKEAATGMFVDEVVKLSELQDFIRRSLRSDERLEKDIEVPDGNDVKTLQLRSSPLKSTKGRRIGTVIGLNDITHLRRLESHRRDFVANVSHELRTPLTSIHGFAETLLNPEVDDPTQIRKFLEIIHRHAVRLGAIIEDLLALSRIEREVEEHSIELLQRPIRPTLTAAVELCEMRAKQKGISINMECDSGIESKINPPLLEQALVNLIDNSLKYSEASSTVDVQVKPSAEGEVTISVRDFGSGISAEHLPRLFERFYRVDKARSRKMGGTGLGLSIVKHITLAHKGSLEVQSQLGEGSTFVVTLPASPVPST